MPSEKTKKWPELPWDEVVDRVVKSLYRVYAGQSAGTCFLVSLGLTHDKTHAYAIFATAWHVVKDMVDSTDDIQLVSADKQKTFSSRTDLISFAALGNSLYDTALIIAKTGDPIVSQSDLLPILPTDSMLARGAEIGWLGFPGVVEPEPCFFHGYISGYLRNPPTYLVDGVAINGVSGGPAIDNRAHLIGLVSAYLPNRLDKTTTLPGMTALIPINAIRYYMEHVLGADVL
ncbi:MAG: trypsin-like peptidase domain-containing protein [Anaerolineales bacterium]